MVPVHHLIVLTTAVPASQIRPSPPAARTCTTCCPDTGCDTWFSDCPATSCCTETPVCGPCTGQTCQGTFPNCSGTPGTGTQSCTACGHTFTQPWRPTTYSCRYWCKPTAVAGYLRLSIA